MLAPVFVLPMDPALFLILFCLFMVSKAILTNLDDTSISAPLKKTTVLPSDRHASLKFFPVVAASPRPSSFQESYRSPQQTLGFCQGAKTRICAPAA